MIEPVNRLINSLIVGSLFKGSVSATAGVGSITIESLSARVVIDTSDAAVVKRATGIGTPVTGRFGLGVSIISRCVDAF